MNLLFIIQIIVMSYFVQSKADIMKCEFKNINGTIVKSCKKAAICAKGCGENEECIEFDRCGCRNGYERLSMHHKCQAVCEPACTENFTCVAPNICDCVAGYTLAFGKCTKKCIDDSDCMEHSKCNTHTGQCQCEEDYGMNEHSICKPKCAQECNANAFCSSPNICSCLTGFQNISGHCMPVCTPNCTQNAYCATPNQCKCHAGYTLTNGACIPICSPTCEPDSECIAPNNCHAKSKPSEATLPTKCLKEVNIFIVQLHIPCDQSAILTYFGYSLIVVFLVIIYIAYKNYKHKRAARNRNENLMVNYQPILVREENHSTITTVSRNQRESPPPAYGTLTIKPMKKKKLDSC